MARDILFLDLLAEVAMSVASPSGGSGPGGGLKHATYTPASGNASSAVPGAYPYLVPCATSCASCSELLSSHDPHAFMSLRTAGARIKVSSSFVRSPDVGTLSPALILELEGVLLEQVNMMERDSSMSSIRSMLRPGGVLRPSPSKARPPARKQQQRHMLLAELLPWDIGPDSVRVKKGGRKKVQVSPIATAVTACNPHPSHALPSALLPPYHL